MNWTKSALQKQIRDSELGIKMAADIADTVKKFEHYARVDKRFLDALKELGYWAAITKETYSVVLNIGKTVRGEEWGRPHSAEANFRLYTSGAITWEKIKHELKRYDYATWLKEAQDKLAVLEEETKAYGELLSLVEAKKFLCFDNWEILHKMKIAYQSALK